VTNRFIKLFPIYNLLFAVPSSPPESPQCDVLGSTSIYITWSPPDIDGQNGKIKGYKVFYISVDELYGKSIMPLPTPQILSHLRSRGHGVEGFTSILHHTEVLIMELIRTISIAY